MQILIDIRLARILTACFVGAALAMSGTIFQGVLQNPLADPYILGVSSGAALGAAIALFFDFMSYSGVSVCAFLGALMTVFIILALTKYSGKKSVVHLILAGIIINAFFSACLMLVFFFNHHELSGMMQWLMGDLGHSGLRISALMLLFTVIIGAYVQVKINTLTILSIGDDYALNLGVNPKTTRRLFFIVSSCLTGLAVSVAGIIGFVGLIIPHMLRLVVGDHLKKVFPLSALLGAIFLMTVDLVSRVGFSVELPIGVVTAFIGAPFFLWLLLKKR